MFKFAVIITIAFFIQYTLTFPSGAPITACESMKPSHSGAQTFSSGISPFRISFTNYTNSSISVNLYSQADDFKGFILEARRFGNKTPIGKWLTEIPQTKTIDCFNLEDSAVTHRYGSGGSIEFKNVTFTWFYPSNQTLDGIYFVATVVKEYDLIYMNVTRNLEF